MLLLSSHVRNWPRLCQNALYVIHSRSMILLLRRDRMRRFVEGIDRGQARLFPECLADWIVNRRPNLTPDLECAPRTGRDYAAVLTMCWAW